MIEPSSVPVHTKSSYVGVTTKNLMKRLQTDVSKGNTLIEHNTKYLISRIDELTEENQKLALENKDFKDHIMDLNSRVDKLGEKLSTKHSRNVSEVPEDSAIIEYENSSSCLNAVIKSKNEYIRKLEKEVSQLSAKEKHWLESAKEQISLANSQASTAAKSAIEKYASCRASPRPFGELGRSSLLVSPDNLKMKLECETVTLKSKIEILEKENHSLKSSRLGT